MIVLGGFLSFLLQISIIFSNFKLYKKNSHYNLKMKISCCKLNLNEQIIMLISFAIFDKKKTKLSCYMCICKLKTNHILYWDKFI